MMVRVIVMILVVAVCVVVEVHARSDEAFKEMVHEASGSINENMDREKINLALYRQLRPIVKRTDLGISEQSVDVIVREYVESKYAPVLLDNYSILYRELQSNGKDFTDCNKPESMQPKSEILRALCIEVVGGSVEIGYMTNGYSEGWRDVMRFVFSIDGDKAVLVQTRLRFNDEKLVSIPGV